MILRQCACGAIAPKRGACPVCSRDSRPSSAERGYGARWRKGPRARQLRLYPWCQWVVDGKECGARATDVDHIVRRRLGGPDSPSNLQSLCHSHHSTKTATEMQG